MPVPKLVTYRLVVLEYDGTNSADILAMANTGYDPAPYSIDSEGGGTLVLESAQPSVYSNLILAVGDFCQAGGNAISAAYFPDRFVVLGDA